MGDRLCVPAYRRNGEAQTIISGKLELVGRRFHGGAMARREKALPPITPGHSWKPAMLKMDEYVIAFGVTNEPDPAHEQ